MIPWFFAAFVILLVALTWLVRRRAEAFVDSGETPTDPKAILQKVRGLLARYNDPALWEHLETVAGRDIGELARVAAAENAAKQ
jgi:hypothetical protein